MENYRDLHWHENFMVSSFSAGSGGQPRPDLRGPTMGFRINDPAPDLARTTHGEISFEWLAMAGACCSRTRRISPRFKHRVYLYGFRTSSPAAMPG